MQLKKQLRSGGHANYKSSPVCFSGLQLVDDYMACLKSVPIHPARRDFALDIIFAQLRSIYTYSGLVVKSSETDAEVPPGVDFKIHSMALVKQIAEISAGCAGGKVSMQLYVLLDALQDAHTSLQITRCALLSTRPSPSKCSWCHTRMRC